MRVTLQPAYLLHSRPYRDSSYLLEVLTAQYGRISLVARAVYRKAPGGNLRSLLQPFRPLLVSFSGKSELMTLNSVESVPGALTLTGERLFSGLYVNELLLRLLYRQDTHPALFVSYGETLKALAGSAQVDMVLRRFESQLLTELGYAFDLHHDAYSRRKLRKEGCYRYFEGSGLVEVGHHDPGTGYLYAGCDLLACAEGNFEAAPLTAKRLLRQMLAEHLGDRPLHTRELFLQYRNKSSVEENM
ncbi:MAG: DNA repair protein RecO [Parahaliea sp.]